MKQYKPYPKYKPSGIEWLGDVPEHWGVRRLKYVASCNDDSLPEDTDVELVINYVDISNVSNTRINKSEEMLFGNAPSRARRLVKDGDIIVSTVRTYLRAVAVITKPIENIVVSTGFAVIRPRSISNKFLAYSLMSNSFIEWVVSESKGVSYPAINSSDIMNLCVTMPPAHEQGCISAFLNHQTTQIDRLIEKKEQFIKLLQEKRQALITAAVTGKFDVRTGKPYPKYKPSGIEWLGEVPAHWEVKKLSRWFLTYGSGTTPSQKYYVDHGVPWVTTTELREDIILKTEKNVSYEAIEKNAALKIHPKNSLVIAMYGATVGRIGTLGIAATVNQACFVIHPNKNISLSFLSYWFQGFRNEIAMLARGSGQPNISGDKIKSLYTAAPSEFNEQTAITFYLDHQTAQIDHLIEKTRQSIDLLKEKRTALITAAVTGKIDVRDWKPEAA